MSEEQQPRLRVESYAGYRAEEEPRRFFLDEREISVLEVIDRWREPAYRYFRVRGDDEGTYTLRHDLSHDRWEMTMLGDDTRPSPT